MDIANLLDQRHFDPAKMQKNPVFETDKMFIDQYCLMPGQAQKVHSHGSEDKVYIVLEGTATVHIGGEERELESMQAAIARAGTEHGVRNATEEPLVLLVAMAPRPDHA
jgi:mannose-6-phosphate isomerase-like protein (cupin superfamily)